MAIRSLLMLREIEEAMNTIYRRSSQLHEVTIGGALLILIMETEA